MYVINFGDCQKIYDAVTEQQSIKALGNGEVQEENYLQMIDTYFNAVADYKSFEESRKFFDSMKRLRYDGENESECPVSHFKIIDEKGFAVSIFIEVDERATECRKAFCRMIHKEISKSAFEPYKKDFNQRIIAVPKYLQKAKELIENKSWLVQDSILWVKPEQIDAYYNITTGFNRSKETREAFAFL